MQRGEMAVSNQARREMLLVAFMQASNCSNYTGSWRHPETAPNFLDLQYYQDIARTLEAGKFHMAFIDDRLAMPSRYGDSYAEAVEHGVRAVKLDLVPIITAMGLATSHLGLGATYSTTYYAPFHVARLFASLDHFTGGRAAWNVVTSLNDSEAHNFGVSEHLEHDDRYDLADEFMEAAIALWDSWQDERCDRRPGIRAVRRLAQSAAGRLSGAVPEFAGAADLCPGRRRATRSSFRRGRARGAGSSPRDGASCCS